MRKSFILKAIATLLTSALAIGAAAAQSEGERKFVEGTNLFRQSSTARDPLKGLALLQESAALGYRLAPYGLCIALSAEPEILNLVESYAWCRVAAKRNNKFSHAAESRALEVLGRIAVSQHAEAVSAAKVKATEYEAAFKDEP